MARRGDIDSLPERAARAEGAVRNLSRGFEDLSRSGRLSASSVQSFGNTFAMLGGRAGLAAAGIGIAISTILRLREALSNARLDVLENGMRNLVEVNNTYIAQQREMATAGRFNREETEKVAQKIGQIADAERARNDVLQKSIDATKLGGVVSADQVRAWAAEAAALERVRGELELEKLALEEEAKAAEKAGTEADNFAKSVERMKLAQIGAADVAAADKAIRAQLTAGIREQIDLLDLEIEKKQLDADLEIERDGAISAATSNAIAAARARRAALEQEKAAMEEVAAIAESAIAGTAAGAFDVYADALDETVSLNNLASASFGRAMQNMAASTIRSVGQQAAIKAGYALAEGFFLLANKDFQGAKDSFQAAAIYTGVAAAAGVGSGLVSVSGGGGGRLGGGGSGGGDTKAEPAVNQYITVVGTLDADAAENLERQLREARERRDLA